MQAGAVVHQISLSDVAAHAVAQQKQGRSRVSLADRLAEGRQIVHDLAPAIFVGEMPEPTLQGGSAMAPLIMRIQGDTRCIQRCAESPVAAAVFGHAVGKHYDGKGRRVRQPCIDVKSAVVAGVKPECLVLHGDVPIWSGCPEDVCFSL